MVVVIAAGLRRLVAGDAVPRVDALHQPQVGERLERAVDGGDPDRTAGPAQLVVDVLRAETAVLAAEELDDGLPGPSPAIAGSLERDERVVRPRHLRECIFSEVISRIVLIILSLVLLAGCGATGSTNGRKSVVAAFYPVAFAAGRI